MINPIFEENLFSKQNCKDILNCLLQWEDKESYNESSKYGVAAERLRKSFYSSVGDFENLSYLLLKKLKRFNIKSIPEDTMYIRYEKGCYFLPHKDTTPVNNPKDQRLYTAIIQLSESTDYQGGELIVDGLSMSKNIGNFIMFRSNITHEVKKITSGTRDIIVMMFNQNNFNEGTEKKSLL